MSTPNLAQAQLDPTVLPTLPTVEVEPEPESEPEALYRFFGASTTIGYHQINVFGQLVALPKSLADDAILGGSELLPEEKFADTGFTEEELESHSNLPDHTYWETNPVVLGPGRKPRFIHTVEPEFRIKKLATHRMIGEYRNSLEKARRLKQEAETDRLIEEGKRLDSERSLRTGQWLIPQQTAEFLAAYPDIELDENTDHFDRMLAVSRGENPDSDPVIRIQAPGSDPGIDKAPAPDQAQSNPAKPAPMPAPLLSPSPTVEQAERHVANLPIEHSDTVLDPDPATESHTDSDSDSDLEVSK